MVNNGISNCIFFSGIMVIITDFIAGSMYEFSCNVQYRIRAFINCIYFNTAKTLGLLQPHFRLSQLHQCDQGMLPNRFS